MAGPAAGPVLAAADVPRLGCPEVSVVEFAGEALSMTAPALRGYIEPLLATGDLAAIQLPTRALACWPYRFLPGPDADDTLRLFEQAAGRGTAVMLLAGFAHPRELEPGPAAKAAAWVRSTGAMICTTGTLAGTVNDDAATWAALWRAQVRMGMVPYAMTIQHVTGPAVQYRVPLAQAHQVFAAAYSSVAGLARTVRGPVMCDQHGTVCVDGIAQAGSQKMFALRYLQARDPRLAGQPFFAAYDPGAAWPGQLQPAPGTSFPGQARLSQTRRSPVPGAWHDAPDGRRRPAGPCGLPAPRLVRRNVRTGDGRAGLAGDAGHRRSGGRDRRCARPRRRPAARRPRRP